jgi:alkylation response protein AidB-like acyl-CoA dehydrogenase
MDFEFSEFQKELNAGSRQWAAASCDCNARERDRQSEFSRAAWKLAAEYGLQAMFVPQEYGGTGLPVMDIVAILEGVGYGAKDRGLVFSINAHIWACQTVLCLFGNEAQKQWYLPGMANGQLVAANAMTEPNTGSDVYAMETRAALDREGYVLSGRKTFVTNGPVADLFFVYARTNPKASGFMGISCFLVEKGTPGLTCGKPIEKMGLRTSPMCEVAFEECRVPRENLVGSEGSGAIMFQHSMEWEKNMIFVTALGAMEKQIEVCMRHARLRQVQGRPLSKQPVVAHRIAEMKMRLETSRLLIHRAAWLKCQKKTNAVESALAKWHTSEAYVQNCRDAMQLFGGYGYMVEYDLERELRDALAGTIYSGTTEIQKNLVAGLMGM